MPFSLVMGLFFTVVIVAHLLEGITGFGSTALSIPVLTVLLGIDIAKPVLMMYTLLLCIYILARSIRQVDWRNLRVIIGVAACGMPVGLLLYNRLPKELLLILLAIFMIGISIRGLLLAFGVLRQKRVPKTGALVTALLTGGVIQGAFASGGPLIILYATEKVREKSRFRATMCMVWLILDSVLLGQMSFADQLGPEVWKTALWGLPSLAIGTLLGDLAHRRVSDRLFTRLIYAILLLSGIFVFFNLG